MDRFLVRKRPADAGRVKQITILFGSSKWKQFRIDMKLYGFLCICIILYMYMYNLCAYVYMLDVHVCIYIYLCVYHIHTHHVYA